MTTTTNPTQPRAGCAWRMIATYTDGHPLYQSHHRTHGEAITAAAKFYSRRTYLGLAIGSVTVTEAGPQ